MDQNKSTNKLPSREIIVVQYEQFFHVSESNDITEQELSACLMRLQEMGGAHIIGAYITHEDLAFKLKAVSSIEVPVNKPTRLVAVN